MNERQKIERALAKASTLFKGGGWSWVEVPASWARSVIAKAKYLKRVLTGRFTKTGKPIYRYFYKYAHGGGIHNQEHMEAGNRFAHGEGHYEIVGRDGETVHLLHTRTGERAAMTRDQFGNVLLDHHWSNADRRREVGAAQAEVVSASVHGTSAQRSAADARLGVVMGPRHGRGMDAIGLYTEIEHLEAMMRRAGLPIPAARGVENVDQAARIVAMRAALRAHHGTPSGRGIPANRWAGHGPGRDPEHQDPPAAPEPPAAPSRRRRRAPGELTGDDHVQRQAAPEESARRRRGRGRQEVPPVPQLPYVQMSDLAYRMTPFEGSRDPEPEDRGERIGRINTLLQTAQSHGIIGPGVEWTVTQSHGMPIVTVTKFPHPMVRETEVRYLSGHYVTEPTTAWQEAMQRFGDIAQSAWAGARVDIRHTPDADSEVRAPGTAPREDVFGDATVNASYSDRESVRLLHASYESALREFLRRRGTERTRAAERERARAVTEGRVFSSLFAGEEAVLPKPPAPLGSDPTAREKSAHHKAMTAFENVAWAMLNRSPAQEARSSYMLDRLDAAWNMPQPTREQAASQVRNMVRLVAGDAEGNRVVDLIHRSYTGRYAQDGLVREGEGDYRSEGLARAEPLVDALPASVRRPDQYNHPLVEMGSNLREFGRSLALDALDIKQGTTSLLRGDLAPHAEARMERLIRGLADRVINHARLVRKYGNSTLLVSPYNSHFVEDQATLGQVAHNSARDVAEVLEKLRSIRADIDRSGLSRSLSREQRDALFGNAAEIAANAARAAGGAAEAGTRIAADASGEAGGTAEAAVDVLGSLPDAGPAVTEQVRPRVARTPFATEDEYHRHLTPQVDEIRRRLVRLRGDVYDAVSQDKALTMAERGKMRADRDAVLSGVARLEADVVNPNAMLHDPPESWIDLVRTLRSTREMLTQHAARLDLDSTPAPTAPVVRAPREGGRPSLEMDVNGAPPELAPERPGTNRRIAGVDLGEKLPAPRPGRNTTERDKRFAALDAEDKGAFARERRTDKRFAGVDMTEKTPAAPAPKAGGRKARFERVDVEERAASRTGGERRRLARFQGLDMEKALRRLAASITKAVG